MANPIYRHCCECNTLFDIPKNNTAKKTCSKTCYMLLISKINKKEHILKDKIGIYLSNPAHCMQCNSIIDYVKRKNKFCSSSCSATYNNTGRVRSDKSRKALSIKRLAEGKKICHVSWCKLCGLYMPNTKNKYCRPCRSKNNSAKMIERNKITPFGGHTSKLRINYV